MSRGDLKEIKKFNDFLKELWPAGSNWNPGLLSALPDIFCKAFVHDSRTPPTQNASKRD